MTTWYSFSAKASAPAIAELTIHDYIGYYGVEAATFGADLAKIDAKVLNVSVNSPGGDVFQAVAIMSMLRNSGKKINMTVLGIAASAAAYIVLAGDKRSMPDNAMMMLHNASWEAAGNADKMQEAVDVLRKMDATLQATFVQRTGQTPAVIAELLSKDTWLTAAECLEYGLIDEVTPALKMTAAFDVNLLPTAVRAVYDPPKTHPQASVFEELKLFRAKLNAQAAAYWKARNG